MFSIISENKKLFLFLLLLIALPILVPLISTIIDILFNLGIYFGSIARCTLEGICCK